MKPKNKRLVFVAIGAGLLAAAAALVLTAIGDTVTYFRTPSDIVEKRGPLPDRIRIGGLVEQGSLVHAPDGTVEFRVTDLANTVSVRYRGVLPDLFREGQGVVAEGRITDGVLKADQVLARHDERYMPPEAVDALKQSGEWQRVEDALRDAGQMHKEATQ